MTEESEEQSTVGDASEAGVEDRRAMASYVTRLEPPGWRARFDDGSWVAELVKAAPAAPSARRGSRREALLYAWEKWAIERLGPLRWRHVDMGEDMSLRLIEPGDNRGEWGMATFTILVSSAGNIYVSDHMGVTSQHPNVIEALAYAAEKSNIVYLGKSLKYSSIFFHGEQAGYGRFVPSPLDLKGKVVEQFDCSADNVWYLYFTDGTSAAIEAEIDPVLGLPVIALAPGSEVAPDE